MVNRNGTNKVLSTCPPPPNLLLLKRCLLPFDHICYYYKLSSPLPSIAPRGPHFHGLVPAFFLTQDDTPPPLSASTSAFIIFFSSSSNFRRSNETVAINPSPTITPFLCPGKILPHRHLSLKLISVEFSSPKVALSCKPRLLCCSGETTFCDAICLYWGSVLARALSLKDCLE